MKLPNGSARLLTVAFCTLMLIPSGCSKKDGSPHSQMITIYTPVYESKDQVLSGINGKASEPLANTGKIYIKDNYIFLNEIDKGIHVIDNTDPRHPKQTAFLNIPGNRDIAVKGDVLYADMYSNMLSIDISDIHHVSVTKMLYGIFYNQFNMYSYGGDSNLVVVSYTKKDTIVENGWWGVPGCAACETFTSSDSKGNVSKAGVAGSMAKMVLIKEHLYAITESHSTGIINVANASDPVFVSTNYGGFDLETIYPFEDKLFLGSSIGVYMYDVSDPEKPAPLGQFSHGRACDPVVTDGKFAYVTLHSGSSCGSESNELDVLDIADIMNPSLLKTYPLTKPTGLGKDGDLLFVCDGSNTVNVYNAKSPSDLKLLDQIQTGEPFDVIAQNNIALIVAADGLYQFDYSSPSNTKKLSFLATTAPKDPGSRKY